MKKALLIIISLLLIGCAKPVKEKIYFYSSNSETYNKYGYYSEIRRNYPYYKTHTTITNLKDNPTHAIMFVINGYGDTVRIIWVDYSNYPKRWEDSKE